MATGRSCLQVVREVDGGHAALAEFALDAVAAGQGMPRGVAAISVKRFSHLSVPP